MNSCALPAQICTLPSDIASLTLAVLMVMYASSLHLHGVSAQPRMADGDVDICQSNAMIRHMARKV